jgi:chromate transporter
MTDTLSPSPLPEATSPPMATRPAPRSKTELFVAFSLLALQGFGGVLAVVQRELVDKRKWLTPEEFVEDWAVAQILPGPNVVNLSLMLGDRYFGLRGALVGVAGMLCFPLLLVLLVAAAFAGVADNPQAQGALRGMGAVAAGLIGAAGLRLATALRTNVMGRAACAAMLLATFVAIAFLRVPLAWVLLGIGGVGCMWAYVCLGKVAAQAAAKDAP